MADFDGTRSLVTACAVIAWNFACRMERAKQPTFDIALSIVSTLLYALVLFMQLLLVLECVRWFCVVHGLVIRFEEGHSHD